MSLPVGASEKPVSETLYCRPDRTPPPDAGASAREGAASCRRWSSMLPGSGNIFCLPASTP